jgi:hypothetical protein
VPLGPYLANLARLNGAQQVAQGDAGQGDAGHAQALLSEALALGGPGVTLAAVEVYTALGTPGDAKRSIDAAYREAWADGPPYAFVYELSRIRTALQTLGLPEPQLPPFDPSRVPPVPDEAEIRVLIEEVKRQQAEETVEDEADEADEEDEDALPDGLLTAPAETAPSARQNGKRPWWKFWSQN